MIVLAWLFGLVVLVVVIAALVTFLNHFYRKSSRDVAIIRTGFGGQKNPHLRRVFISPVSAQD